MRHGVGIGMPLPKHKLSVIHGLTRLKPGAYCAAVCAGTFLQKGVGPILQGILEFVSHARGSLPRGELWHFDLIPHYVAAGVLHS